MAYQPGIREVHCPRGCGWQRSYHLDPNWQREQYRHLVYGYITRMDAVRLDLSHHNCRSYLAAVTLLRQRLEGKDAA